jgi:hypothetical protein
MTCYRNAIGAALLGFALLSGEGHGTVLPPDPYAWQTIPFGGGGYVDGFLYHPKEKNLLYARTDVGGMYRFDFAAKRWIPLLDHLPKADSDLMGVISMAIDPNDPNKIYAACGLYLPDWARKGAILRSGDRGKSWEKTDLPIHIGGNSDGRGSGERLVVDPKDSSILWYGSNTDGLWKSTDGGKTFSKENSKADSISLVALHDAEIFVGSADGDGALLVSKNDGELFWKVPGTPDMVPQRMVFAADGTAYVTFAHGDGKQAANPSYASSGAVWKRDVSGKWSEISPVRTDSMVKFGYSGVDVGPDGTLAVSTLDRWVPGDEVFLSDDGGEHWVALGEHAHHDATPYPWLVDYMRGEDRMGHWISDLKINPFNRDELIYGTGYGLWMSRNLSAASVTFDFAVANLEEAATMQLASPPSGPVLLAAFGDVAGAAFSDLTKTPQSGLFRPTTETNYSIDYAGLKPSFLARVTNNDPTHGFLSDDSGATWTAFGATPYPSQDGKSEWHNPGALAVSAGGTSLLWVPQKEAGTVSLDRGKTWKLSAGWPSQREQALIPVADKAVDGVFYVFDKTTGTLLVSVDAGLSFKAAVNGLPRVESWQTAQLAVVPGRMRDVWLAAPYGLLHSPDSETAVTNVKDVSSAWAVGFGAPKVTGAYPAVYLWGKVKGQDGLWRSDDEGANWARINDDAHQFGGFSAITGDMRSYGTVYVAPYGRGLMSGTPGK